MIIKEMILPDYCYNPGRRNRPNGEIIHWFSAINIDKEKRFEPDLIYKLLIDMNLDPADRQYDIYHGPRWPGSYQFMIFRDGVIWQLVPEDKKSYHAGRSQGVTGATYLNTKTIGTAWVGAKGEPFPDEQYNSGAWLSKYLMDKYSYPYEHVERHSTVRKRWNDNYPDKKKAPKPDPGVLFDQKRHKDLVFA